MMSVSSRLPSPSPSRATRPYDPHGEQLPVYTYIIGVTACKYANRLRNELSHVQISFEYNVKCWTICI